MQSPSPPPAPTERASLRSVLGALQHQVEAILAEERAHPESVSAVDRAMIGVLYGLLVESRQLNRLTVWLMIATLAVLTEAIVEFVLFYFFLH